MDEFSRFSSSFALDCLLPTICKEKCKPEGLSLAHERCFVLMPAVRIAGTTFFRHKRETIDLAEAWKVGPILFDADPVIT